MATDERIVKGPSAPPLSAGGPSLVPKVFHFVWFGDVPDHLVKYIDSWRLRHKGWSFKLWDEQNMPNLHNQEIFDRAEEIAGPGRYQLMSDILRYEVMESEGGVYVDCDFECRKPLDDLIRGLQPELPAAAAWEVQGTWLNNALMAALPGHPIFTQLIDELPASVERRQPGQRPNSYSGPQFFTPIARQYAESMTFWPQHWFYPYAYNELHRQGEEFNDCFAVHHWNNQRKKHGLVEA